MFISADQILAALVGDYILQSHTMAIRKVMNSTYAFYHSLIYSLPFFFLTANPLAILVIIATHFVIDRWRLARYFVWFKNYIFHPHIRPGEITATGFPEETPIWLAGWLMIIVDNIFHIVCNGLALRYAQPGFILDRWFNAMMSY